MSFFRKFHFFTGPLRPHRKISNFYVFSNRSVDCIKDKIKFKVKFITTTGHILLILYAINTFPTFLTNDVTPFIQYG